MSLGRHVQISSLMTFTVVFPGQNTSELCDLQSSLRLRHVHIGRCHPLSLFYSKQHKRKLLEKKRIYILKSTNEMSQLESGHRGKFCHLLSIIVINSYHVHPQSGQAPEFAKSSQGTSALVFPAITCSTWKSARGRCSGHNQL